jgi:formate/nitrite transporter FocA (FNT family)
VGGAFFTGVMDVSSLGHGPSRLLGGVVFSCGLLLVCASGAELSTGNCLLATAWATRSITVADVGRNLAVSYIANAAGALAFAMLIADSGLLQSEYGRTAAAIADAKMNLGFGPAFVRGDHLKTRWPHFSDQRITLGFEHRWHASVDKLHR